MNEKQCTCPLLTIASGAAGRSRFMSCIGEFCAWFDPVSQSCSIQNIGRKE